MTFKNTCILLLLMVFSTSLFAQDFQGVATYKSYRKIDLKGNEQIPVEVYPEPFDFAQDRLGVGRE